MKYEIMQIIQENYFNATKTLYTIFEYGCVTYFWSAIILLIKQWAETKAMVFWTFVYYIHTEIMSLNAMN